MVVIVRVMTRIPYVRREELGPEGQQLWDSIVDGRAVQRPPGITLRRWPGMNLYAGAGLEPGTPPARRRVS
jgi:hypothetical protein